jgi:glycerol kinase
MRIAAVDQGTTSTRALVLAPDGAARIVANARHRQHHPAPGWVEHDPVELVSHVEACLEAAGAVDAVGLDNQGESCLAWDAATGEPLSPVLVWQDERTRAVTERLKAAGVEALTLERAGLPLDPYFSATKLAWLHAQLPAAARGRHLRLGTTDAFFLRRLTGVDATDVTTASRTSLMNLATGAWDDELCGAFGVPREALPPIRATVDDFGTWRGVPVRASVVDQQAALYGHGCRAPGDLKITFGTGAFVLAVTGEDLVHAPGTGLLPTVAWQIGERRVHALDGGVYNAGSAVEWALRLGLVADLAALDAFDRPPAIDRELVCVPALDGLGCPHWDRGAGALTIGMRQATDGRDLAQAVLEGVALLTAEVVATMARHVPGDAAVSVDGGLVRSGYFRRFLASVLDRPVRVPAFDELTALGCAQLAGGRDAGRPEAGAVVDPDGGGPARRARFAEAVARSRGWRAP